MKEIVFRPLRINNKTGKIIVASYPQWRSIKTADYNNFNLVIDESYKMLNDDDFIYNHKGKQLFFYDYNPGKVPILVSTGIEDKQHLKWQVGNNFIILNKGTIYSPEDWFTFRMDGTDCDGVPTLNFYTADYIATHSSYIHLFEPLTVGMVKMWFGWFLWQLDNSSLKTKN